MHTKLVLATSILLATMGAIAEPRKIEVVPLCLLSSTDLMVRTIIETTSTPAQGEKLSDSPRTKSRAYWVINCSLITGNCSAAELQLKPIEDGKPIRIFDLVPVEGMRLVSVTGGIATMVWGIHTFTLDIPKRQMSVRASGSMSDDFGSGSCPHN